MQYTSNIEAKRPTPTRNIAAHVRATRRKETREAKRASEIRTADLFYSYEKRTPEEMRIAGMKASLNRYKVRIDLATVHPADRTIEIRAIDHNTGETRIYRTRYESDIKFIGNTDYMAYGKKRTTYLVIVHHHQYEGGMMLIDQREAGAGN